MEARGDKRRLAAILAADMVGYWRLMKTAATLGPTIPPALLIQATELIE